MQHPVRDVQQGIACAGNWIVDIVHTASHWPEKGDLVRLNAQHIGVGGGAANVLTDLASFQSGFPLAAIGCIGDDINAGIITAHCEKIGVDASDLVAISNSLTAYDEVISVPGDSRTFFYHGGANDLFDSLNVPIEKLSADGYRILYLGYLMLLGELDRMREDGTTGASRLLERARAAGMITCVDLVSDANPSFRTVVAPSLPHCDYLIVNEVEAGRASSTTVRGPIGELLHDGLERASEALLAAGVNCAVVIHAPEGALWHGAGLQPLWIPSRPVSPDEIVSPVGAGDAFCAAVIYGIHENWPSEQTLRVAHLAAVACLGGATATDGIPPMAVLLANLEAIQSA